MLKSFKKGITILLFAGISIAAFSFNDGSGILNASPKNYYFNSESNNKHADGSLSNPYPDLSKISNLKLNPGDSILLASGTSFSGSLELTKVNGAEKNPIVISIYPSGVKSADIRATIDAKGFPNGILIENCSHIELSNLIVTANAGGMKTSNGKTPDMRCGILVQTSNLGKYADIVLANISVKDVFYEEPGFTRGKGEVNSANGTQRYGWGIRFINNTDGAMLQDLKIENCQISNTAHTGVKFTAKAHGIQNISVLNNRVTETGGPGMQMSGVENGLVKGNYIDSSGSNNDTRKWGRGSGLWTWGTSNVVIENNSFLNANGPGDSAGCHIDFNCSDVVVQYNLSANNAGGFCEILGNNYNCAYRYNVSVNDGYRAKGVDGAFQAGKTFWLSGYVGNKQKPTGPFNSYFYNNTIYARKGIVANFAVTNSASGVLIANNIFCIQGESKLVAGDQYVPDKITSVPIPNVIFENNLYLSESNWPKQVLIQDQKPMIGNPEFRNEGGLKIEDYIPSNAKLLRNKGIEIRKIPNDQIGLKIGLKVEHDILGNKISGTPDMGAIEIL
ncbi:MAG: right-handed parallel beta-helix repeat-containing protein [Prolixibacteraceae bacterium]